LFDVVERGSEEKALFDFISRVRIGSRRPVRDTRSSAQPNTIGVLLIPLKLPHRGTIAAFGDLPATADARAGINVDMRIISVHKRTKIRTHGTEPAASKFEGQNNRNVVMRTLLISLAIVLAASPSFAISRLSPLSMSCEQARAAVHSEGSVIFRWTSPRGLPIYDRYVRNSRFCEAHEYAAWKGIPTRDTKSCQVLNCQDIDNLDGTFIIPDNSL